MSAGEILIPAFQRSLVWNNEQIRALLESVYKGYPIGSLLLWQAPADTFKPYIPEKVQLPEGSRVGLAMFLLDGMQRLTTLYAAFNGGGGPDNRFEAVFGLREQEFIHDTRGRHANDPMFLLKRVFVPRQFLQDQANLAKLEESDRWLNMAVELHSRFQEYLLPIVTIDTSVEDGVKIFTNTNREGLSLSTVDFMRALTWHNDFDLNASVARIRNELPATFAPDDETLAKTIALMLGIDPLPDTILKLQSVSVAELNKGVDRATAALQGVARFLKNRLGIASADFVPYEGQLLVLVGLYSAGTLDDEAETHLVKWFLSTSFGEMFQGRPDHAIVQMVKEAVQSLRSGKLELDLELRLTHEGLARKYLRKGTAVSAAFFTLFSLRQARSVTTGNVIPGTDYLETFDAAKLVPLVYGNGSADRVQAGRRQLVNLVLLSAEESYRGLTPESIRKALDASSDEVLKSQMLDKDALALLNAGQFQHFLDHRSTLIVAEVEEILKAQHVSPVS